MSSFTNELHIGLVINPYAGIGGPAGLKGSDDQLLVSKAREEGAQLRTPERALRCLSSLGDEVASSISISCFAGEMGESTARDAGFEPQIIGASEAEQSTAEDTCRAVQEFMVLGVDLVLFAGGDGTARDVCRMLAEQIPVLGIPSGVKMHSGVFAISPEGAAEIVRQMVLGQLVDLREQEVRDIDEAAFRDGVVKSRYFGEMLVPESGQFVQNVKEGGREVEELVLDDIAADLLERMEPDVLYLVGAGTTPRALMEQLGLENTLLGVDAVCNGELLAKDVNAPQLEALVAEHSGDVVAILSITGGQGSLIGRGNQQLSAKVLQRIGRDNLWVLATKTKIRELQGRPLLMDSNDLELDRAWHGFISVTTGYRDSILYPLGYQL